jgi:hypothetical protein
MWAVSANVNLLMVHDRKRVSASGVQRAQVPGGSLGSLGWMNAAKSDAHWLENRVGVGVDKELLFHDFDTKYKFPDMIWLCLFSSLT